MPIDSGLRGQPTPGGRAMFEQREWLRVTLSSIRDAVMTTGSIPIGPDCHSRGKDGMAEVWQWSSNPGPPEAPMVE